MTDVDGVTKRYELTATRAVILDVISSNIIDPLTGTQARSSTTDWIFEGDPEDDRLGQGSGGYKYPIIVFDFSDFDSEVKSLDGSKEKIMHNLSIEVHARTVGDVNGRTAANQLAEEIKNILSVSNVDDLRTACLHYIGINGTSNDIDFKGGNKVYIKTIDYSFQRFD